MQSVSDMMDSVDVDTFKVLLNSSKPRNEILGVTIPEVLQWKFCDVMSLMGDATPFEVVLKVLNFHSDVSEKELLKAPANVFVSVLRFIKDQIAKVNRLQEQLSSEPDGDLVNAGIKDLDKFGHVNIYYAISNDPRDWDAISEVPYGKMFTKLMIDKTNSDIQKRYNQIVMEKSKRK